MRVAVLAAALHTVAVPCAFARTPTPSLQPHIHVEPQSRTVACDGSFDVRITNIAPFDSMLTITALDLANGYSQGYYGRGFRWDTSHIDLPATLTLGAALAIPVTYTSGDDFPSRLELSIDSNDADTPHLFLAYFGLLCATPTPTQPDRTVTETPTLPTPTPTPTICPIGTAQPFSVDDVVSPTNQLSQAVTVHIGNSDRVEIVSEAGTFVATGSFDYYTTPAVISVTLLPDSVNHLHVFAHVRPVTSGGCTYGGYALTRDLIIVQLSGDPTRTQRPSATLPPLVTDVATPRATGGGCAISPAAETPPPGVQLAWVLLPLLLRSVRRRWARVVLCSAAAQLLPAYSAAQAPAFLVKDINTTALPSSSNPIGFVSFAGATFFAATTPATGYELWRTDGTAAGTTLVKDINAGPGDAFPQALTVVGESLFFIADSGSHTGQLWRSDGSAAGTVLVRDLGTTLAVSGLIRLDDQLLIVVRNRLFSEGDQLWRSDGTASGTVFLQRVGPGRSSISAFTVLNGTVFLRTDGRGRGVGQQLWRSDGAAAGTVEVKTLDLGVDISRPIFSSPLVDVAGTLFLLAGNSDFGMDLWKSDGTDAGTEVVKHFTGVGYTFDGELVLMNGVLFFGTSGTLWRSDGTAEGTVQVKQFPGFAAGLTVAGGKLFFSAESGPGRELWVSDGTTAGTMQLKDINPGSQSSSPLELTDLNGALVFTADDGADGEELWVSDGTSDGTVRLKDIHPGLAPSAPAGLVNLGGTLFFTANDGAHGYELWRSDGTGAGTLLVANLAPDDLVTADAAPQQLTSANDRVFFSADDGVHGTEVWVSDGTSAGTVLLDIHPGSASSSPGAFANLGGTVFFSAEDGTHGFELWKSDGTPAGTEMVLDIVPGAAGSSPSQLTTAGDTLFFTAGAYPERLLWKSDGTAAGTMPVPGARERFQVGSALIDVNGTLFFDAGDSAHGLELWRSDGTEDGTMLVKDINPGAAYSYPQLLTNVDGILFFYANDGVHTGSLWKTDGSESGTVRVLDSFDGSAALLPYQFELAGVGRLLFFLTRTFPTGSVLWRTDGTPAGTVTLKKVSRGVAHAEHLTAVGDMLFLVGDTDTLRLGLWKSDGTIGGTMLVSPIDLSPSFLTDVNGRLVFQGCAVGGCEVWESDGTQVGTRRLADVARGPSSSLPGPFVQAGQFIFFPATDPLTGTELWALPLGARPPCTGDCGADRGVGIDDVLTLVDVALGGAAIGACAPGDRDVDGRVTIDEILSAVDDTLRGDCT